VWQDDLSGLLWRVPRPYLQGHSMPKVQETTMGRVLVARWRHEDAWVSKTLVITMT
jgi:hypothetical protein